MLAPDRFRARGEVFADGSSRLEDMAGKPGLKERTWRVRPGEPEMGNFERLIEAAIEQLRGRLLARGWSSTEIAKLCGQIERLGFPGLLAMLGTGENRSGLFGVELLNAAAQDVAFESSPDEDLQSGTVQRFLESALRRHISLAELSVRESEDVEIKQKLFRRGVSALARRSGLTLTLDQTGSLANLLANGEFFSDIASTTAVTLSTVHGLPLAIAEDIRWSPRAIRLLFALKRDLSGTPASAWKVFAELRGGHLDDPPAVLTHTLRVLYESASIAAISEMIRNLLAKDNETFRLAVILYARSAGIPIADADLDVLRDSAFDTDDPNLGPILIRAIERLEKNLGRNSLIDALKHL
jgi:hypothetical protein